MFVLFVASWNAAAQSSVVWDSGRHCYREIGAKTCGHDWNVTSQSFAETGGSSAATPPAEDLVKRQNRAVVRADQTQPRPRTFGDSGTKETVGAGAKQPEDESADPSPAPSR